MALTVDEVRAALAGERSAARKGAKFKAGGHRREGALLVLAVEPLRVAGRGSALDESWEGARATWPGEPEGRGEVAVVDPEAGTVALRFVSGPPPAEGAVVTLRPHDFLSPLIALWAREGAARRALAVLSRSDPAPVVPPRPLPTGFHALRPAQAAAVQASLHRVAVVQGPPGTGKTFTVGATIAHLLARLTKARVLLTGPTNVAVDAALIAADDWLARLGRDDLRGTMARVGSRLDTRRYADRPHLLPPGLHEAAVRVAALEAEEPPRADLQAYVAWKDRLKDARRELKADVRHVAAERRVVALTTASLAHHHDVLAAAPGWHFVVLDEASQVPLPAALMAAALGGALTVAGDPRQLAPIVQSPASGARLLARTAFDALTPHREVLLDEQSRMAAGICAAVSGAFYGGRLRVCPRALADPAWARERSPWFVDGREIPRVLADDRGGAPTWSARYHGLIRFGSAKLVEAMVDGLLGAYAEAGDVLVLTPFRAQRALLRAMLRRVRGLKVGTVHRSQGSESRIVIFDPVDAAGSFLNGEDGARLINVAASRAQAHLLLALGPGDVANPHLRALAGHAAAPGAGWRPRVP